MAVMGVDENDKCGCCRSFWDEFCRCVEREGGVGF